MGAKGNRHTATRIPKVAIIEPATGSPRRFEFASIDEACLHIRALIREGRPCTVQPIGNDHNRSATP